MNNINKAQDPLNFILHKTYDVSKLQNIVSAFNEEWLEDLSRRQNSIHHTKTYSYHLTDADYEWEPYSPYPTIPTYTNQNVFDSVNKIISDLEKELDGKVGRSMFIKLPAGEIITPHPDKGSYLLSVYRCHIPIFTNPYVMFTVGHETINMKSGECWEINNSKFHSVKNNGESDRVHLLVDIIPNILLK